MAIILEGPDAAGKTTLGQMLKDKFKFDLILSGGAPRTKDEVIQYCEMQLSHCHRRDCIIDRVTPISHPVYNPAYRNSDLMADYRRKMLGHSEVVIIYCRPPMEALMRPEKHQWKDYDTEEHKQKILNNQMVYIELYDETFRTLPHIPYDYTMRDEDINIELIATIAASKEMDDALKQLRQIQSTIQRRGLSRSLS